MEYEFDSFLEFTNGLKEVKVLTLSAQENEDETLKYLTFNKSAILLLMAKFESFIEHTIEEYVEIINNMNICMSNLPEVLKINHSLYAIEKNKDILEHKHKTKEQIKLFEDLGKVWNSNKIIKKFSINTKFSYGKHGEKDLIKIFQNLGIEDIFKCIKIYEKSASLVEDKCYEIDFKSKFNSLVNLRNNITHEDATPTLTNLDLNNYERYLESFSNELIKFLNKNLINLKLKCEANEIIKNTQNEVAATD